MAIIGAGLKLKLREPSPSESTVANHESADESAAPQVIEVAHRFNRQQALEQVREQAGIDRVYHPKPTSNSHLKLVELGHGSAVEAHSLFYPRAVGSMTKGSSLADAAREHSPIGASAA